MAKLVDQSGTTVFEGEIADFVAGIPQGGPLTQDLLSGNRTLRGADAGPLTGAQLLAENAAGSGGIARVLAGDGTGFAPGGDATVAAGNHGPRNGAALSLSGATNADSGRATLSTGGQPGVAGEALVSDGSGALVYGGVAVGVGLPVGASAGSLPFAYDTTPGTGGFYFWNGAAWVKIAAIL